MTTPLHIIHSGPLDAGALSSLEPAFDLVLQPVTELGKRDSLSSIAKEINRQIDEIAGWVLLIRSGERVSDELAAELRRLVSDQPVAWAFRISVVEHYCGAPLFRSPRRTTGEIRLFHSRRCRYQKRGEEMELQSKGTVIRVKHSLITEPYRTIGEHVAAVELESHGTGGLSRIPRFVSRLSKDRGRLTTRAIRYHWIETRRGNLSGES